MKKISGRLLIVGHVLVRIYNGRYFVQGAFGRHVDAFAQRFSEVCLLTCAQPVHEPLDEYYLRAQNITIVRIPPIWHPVKAIRYAKMILGMLYAALKLPLVINGSDVIHLRLPSPIGNVGALFARFTRKPVLVYVAGDWEEALLSKGQGAIVRFLAHSLQRSLRFLVDHHLCYTTGPVLAKKFGGPNSYIVSVPSTATDQSHIVESSVALKRTERPTKRLLFVGVVWSAKGVDILLQATQLLREQGRDVHTHIIGRVTDGGEWLRNWVNNLGLQDVVTFHDHMAWDAVIYEYDKSDIFVFPSRPTRGEGVPHVILEAMTRGVPVVASEVAGVPSIVQHGKSGVLVTPGSSSELAQAILTLLDDVELRQRLVLGGLEVAREHTLDNVIDGMIEKVCQRYDLSCIRDV